MRGSVKSKEGSNAGSSNSHRDTHFFFFWCFVSFFGSPCFFVVSALILDSKDPNWQMYTRIWRPECLVCVQCGSFVRSFLSSPLRQSLASEHC